MRPITEFIKYNNTVPLIVAVLLLGTGAVFASNPSVREALFPTDAGPMGPAPAPDSQALVTADISDFDMAFRIDAVREKTDAYVIQYSYRTLEVVDRAWRTVSKAKVMDVPKALLGRRDLGLYAAEEIGEVMDREIAYLGEVQARLSAPSGAGDDAGRYERLSGKTLDPEDRKFDGYQPVVKQKEEEKPAPVTVISLPGTASPVQTVLSKEEVRQIIVDSIANFLAIETAKETAPSEAVLPEPAPIELIPDQDQSEEVPADEALPEEPEAISPDEEPSPDNVEEPTL